jgi:hypothetical protein
MRAIAKRLLQFILLTLWIVGCGFIITFIILCVRWVLTGKSVPQKIDEIEDWLGLWL